MSSRSRTPWALPAPRDTRVPLRSRSLHLARPPYRGRLPDVCRLGWDRGRGLGRCRRARRRVHDVEVHRGIEAVLAGTGDAFGGDADVAPRSTAGADVDGVE